MKRTIFCVILLLLVLGNLRAQESNKWVGGVVYINSESQGNVTNTGYGFAPEFGYYINENFAAGGQIGYFSSIINDDGDKNTDNRFFIMPFARYSFVQHKSLRVFAQADIPISLHSGKNFDGSSKDSYTSISINARPGISYQFNESWGFNMLMPPVFSFQTSSNEESRFYFGVNDGYTIQRYLFNVQLGFTYSF